MRYRAVLHLAVVTFILLITWRISHKPVDVQARTRNILATATRQPKCGLSRVCPLNHFALYVRSGVANVVGPNICFDGKIIMSHVLNNVGPGLNIVVVNDENGVVEKKDFFNMKDRNPEDAMAYLREIKPGMIVLVASFDDVTTKMTTGMREVFVGMGSTLIKSVKYRDSWVFAGRAGSGNNSFFEKAVNDERSNIYEGWPEMVEVAGCFPRTITDGHKPLRTE